LCDSSWANWPSLRYAGRVLALYLCDARELFPNPKQLCCGRYVCCSVVAIFCWHKCFVHCIRGKQAKRRQAWLEVGELLVLLDSRSQRWPAIASPIAFKAQRLLGYHRGQRQAQHFPESRHCFAWHHFLSLQDSDHDIDDERPICT